MPLLNLPIELLYHIASFVHPIHLLQLILTSRAVHSLLYLELLRKARTFTMGAPFNHESVTAWAARRGKLPLLRALIEKGGMPADPGLENGVFRMSIYAR